MTPEQLAESKRRAVAAFAAARERRNNRPKWRSLWVGETVDGEHIHLSPFEPWSLRADIEVLMKAPSMPEWQREGLLSSIVDRIARRPLSREARHEVAANLLRGLAEGVPSRVQPVEPFHRLRWSETTKARHPGGANTKWYPISEDQAVAHLRRIMKRMSYFDFRVRNVEVWTPRHHDAMEPYADRETFDHTAARRLEDEALLRQLAEVLPPRLRQVMAAIINGGARQPADLVDALKVSQSNAWVLWHRLRKELQPLREKLRGAL